MRLKHWARGFALWLLRWTNPQRGGNNVMLSQIPDDREPVSLDPLPGEESMSDEQAEALSRVRGIYHTGSQPLTVARARYDLIRRGVFDDPVS